ncbi:MAG: SAM-dependent methyltransferase [Bacteroidales bacterium]|nr:SAM-dependent methyltransferase [Bacteroidales bacterium]
MQGKLYLIPSTLGGNSIDDVIPLNIKNIINKINFYIVENVRTARRYLKKLEIQTSIDNLTFFTLNKHTSSNDIINYLDPIFNNNDIGIISEAGLPGIADPGAEIVKIAHQKKIDVIPLTGPSSITLALMASGMNGQNFSFVGYLPIKQNERIKKIRFLEKKSKTENQTQIFIETPYRNDSLLADILINCNSHTFLCIATDITLENEFIKTKTINNWKKKMPKLNKRPTIFLLHQ